MMIRHKNKLVTPTPKECKRLELQYSASIDPQCKPECQLLFPPSRCATEQSQGWKEEVEDREKIAIHMWFVVFAASSDYTDIF